MPRALVVVLLSLWCAAGSLAGGEPVVERLLLKNGDRLTGTKETEGDGVLQWKTLFGHTLNIPSDEVEKIEIPDQPPVEELPKEVQPAVLPAPAPEAAVPEPEVAKPPPPAPTPEQIAEAEAALAAAADVQSELENPWALQTIGRRMWRSVSYRAYNWTKRLTVGARYSAGNSDEVMANVQADFERKYKIVNVQVQAGGQYGKSNGVLGANRWFANSTNDFNTGDHWIWFVKHTDEYDQFQNLDYRGTLSAGIGYRFFNEDRKRLIVRLGPAGTYENFRDPDNERLTSDLFGEVEARWPLAKRVQFEHKATVYPNLEDFERVRVNATANLIVSLDERDCWSFQFGVQDQYLSEPNPGRSPHDVTTNLSLIYQRK